MLRSRWAGIGAAALVLAPVMVAADGSGGRVALDLPVRYLDTRSGGTRVTNLELGSGVLNVVVLDPEADGTAVVYPCSDAPDPGEATFTLRNDVPNASFWGTFVTGEATCLTSTTPVHVIVDRWGSVDSVPQPDHLQYVALGGPVVLDDGTAPLPAETTEFALSGLVSPGAAAAVVSLDVLAAAQPGYLTVYDCARPRPLAANVNYSPLYGRRANIALAELDAATRLCVFNFTPANVRVTLLGELSSDGPDPAALPPSWRYVPGEVAPPSLHPITPVRVLDTRSGVGRPGTTPVAPREVVEVAFGNLVGPQSTAVVLNVTVTQPEAAGHLTVYPCGGEAPLASNLNFVAGETVPNLVVAKLGPSRTVCLEGPAAAHVIADLSATFETDGGFRAHPVDPERVLDTRLGIGQPAAARVEAGATLVLDLGNATGVPDAFGAATFNVTVTEPEAAGFVTAFPCDADRPQASNLNYAPGQTVANLVTSRVAPDGTVCLYSKSATHLVADLAAWYAVDEPAGLIDTAPFRLLDTRNGTGAPQAKLDAGTHIELQVGGRGPVPSGADAAVLNLTVVSPEAAGFVTAWPCDRSMPTVSNLNYAAGETNPNLATVRLSASGTVCLFSKARADLVADVTGYLSDELIEGQQLTLVSPG